MIYLFIDMGRSCLRFCCSCITHSYLYQCLGHCEWKSLWRRSILYGWCSIWLFTKCICMYSYSTIDSIAWCCSSGSIIIFHSVTNDMHFFQGFIAILFCIPSGIDGLIDSFSFSSWIFYGLTFVATFCCKFTMKNAERTISVRVHHFHSKQYEKSIVISRFLCHSLF